LISHLVIAKKVLHAAGSAAAEIKVDSKISLLLNCCCCCCWWWWIDRSYVDGCCQQLPHYTHNNLIVIEVQSKVSK